jgi:hypothetical protein
VKKFFSPFQAAMLEQPQSIKNSVLSFKQHGDYFSSPSMLRSFSHRVADAFSPLNPHRFLSLMIKKQKSVVSVRLALAFHGYRRDVFEWWVSQSSQ